MPEGFCYLLVDDDGEVISEHYSPEPRIRSVDYVIIVLGLPCVVPFWWTGRIDQAGRRICTREQVH